MTCTIFKDILHTDTPYYISVEDALERIRIGKSRGKVEEIRNALDKDRAQELKKQLPSVCFSGKFEKRSDTSILEHSGFLVLDFDDIDDLSEKAATISGKPFIYALWVSPSGNGLKALVKIADGKRHRDHFAALKEFFPDVDKSGVNESRVCYESYDPHIYINKNATTFTRTTVTEKIESREILQDESEIFKKILKWLTNKGGSFSKGERNIYIYKLASACCRFGIDQRNAEYLITMEHPTSNDFTQKEAEQTIKSAYKSNSSKNGSAQFDKGVLIDKATRREVELPKEIDMDAPAKDVIYGEYVKENALDIFRKGYAKISGVGIPPLDELFKAKKGEQTCLMGIGNYGKSAWIKWYFVLRILLFKEKFAVFAPEDNPPEELYHDLVEILLGCNCTPYIMGDIKNSDQPQEIIYFHAYDFISKHIFYCYPKDATPTPDYILEVFLELIIKEKVSGVCIDPFNQLSHDYTSGGRTDQYLEVLFGRFSRFAQLNDIYFWIVAHPKTLSRAGKQDYDCPDAFELAGGAMWNNKMENILVYHRPFGNSKPNDPMAEFHTKKIKRQKSVGKKGVIEMQYIARTRRFEIDGVDRIGQILAKSDLSFNKPVEKYTPAAPVEQSEQMKRFLANFQSGTRLPYVED